MPILDFRIPPNPRKSHGEGKNRLRSSILQHNWPLSTNYAPSQIDETNLDIEKVLIERVTSDPYAEYRPESEQEMSKTHLPAPDAPFCRNLKGFSLSLSLRLQTPSVTHR